MSEQQNKGNYEKLYDPKYSLILVIIFTIASTILSLNADFKKLGGLAVNFELRDAIAGNAPGPQVFWSIAAVVISLITALICAIVWIQLNQIEKQREEKSILRRILKMSVFFNMLARISEGVYMIWLSNLEGFWNVIGQAYIILDLIIMVQYVSMSSMIFLSSNFAKNSKQAYYIFIVGMVQFIIGMIALNLYGIDPESYGIGVLLAGAMALLMAILSIVIVFNIFMTIKKIAENQGALKAIAFQLMVFVICAFLLIWMSFTVADLRAGDYFMNLFLRNLRDALFLALSLAYFPAFISPAKKNR